SIGPEVKIWKLCVSPTECLPLVPPNWEEKSPPRGGKKAEPCEGTTDGMAVPRPLTQIRVGVGVGPSLDVNGPPRALPSHPEEGPFSRGQARPVGPRRARSLGHLTRRQGCGVDLPLGCFHVTSDPHVRAAMAGWCVARSAECKSLCRLQ